MCVCMCVYVCVCVSVCVSVCDKIDCLRFLMCPLLGLIFQGFFFYFIAAVINSSNEANKEAGTFY